MHQINDASIRYELFDLHEMSRIGATEVNRT